MAQLPGNPRVNQYIASEGQTEFTYNFIIYNDDEILVQVEDFTLILTTDYTVQDAGNPAGGKITLVSPATEGVKYTLTGNTMIERITTFTAGGDFLASAINGEYDKLDNITSEITTDQQNNFRFAVYNPASSTTVPYPEIRRCLVWDEAGTKLVNSVFDPDTVQGDAKQYADEAEASAEEAALSAAAAQNSADASEASAINSQDSADAAAASAASLDLSAVDEDILPKVDSTYSLGDPLLKWDYLHAENVSVTGELTVGGLTVTAPKAAAFSYQTAFNVDGGDYVASNGWTLRPINNKIYDTIGITLSANSLIVPAGTYKWVLSMAFRSTFYTKARIRQTSGTPSILGATLHTWDDREAELTGNGVFTIADPGPETITIQMVGTATYLVSGMGAKHNTIAMGPCVYLNFSLLKL